MPERSGGAAALRPRLWARMPIKYKIALTVGLMLLAAGVMIALSVSQSRLAMQETYRQENGYYNLNSFQNTLFDADAQLQQYLRDPDKNTDAQALWQKDAELMRRQLQSLDRDLAAVGEERYLLANALVNGFEPYAARCGALFTLWQQGGDIASMYHAYESARQVNDYLQQYARDLQSRALSSGQMTLADLRLRARQLEDTFAVLILTAGVFLFALLAALVRSIVSPVLRLAEESKAISEGNFATPDLAVENRDEIYTLTCAFNHMKHSMQQLVTTLQERGEMEQALHQRELEASENSRLLEQAKMLQLRSQINPHFLFNTLNTISRTARREQAPASERLILSLAHIFRYSLKTDETEVPLQREINIVKDYLAIQTTRFGEDFAFEWRIDPGVEADRLLVPAFVLQPIVENAIIHGLEPKPGGGKLRVRIYLRYGALHLIVSDNGVGMDPARLAEVAGQQRVRGDVSGIGIGNVKKRVLMLCPGAAFDLRSRAGHGTSVRILLPDPRLVPKEPL